MINLDGYDIDTSIQQRRDKEQKIIGSFVIGKELEEDGDRWETFRFFLERREKALPVHEKILRR